MWVMTSAARAMPVIIGAAPSMKNAHTYHGVSLSAPEKETQIAADIAPTVILSAPSAHRIRSEMAQ